MKKLSKILLVSVLGVFLLAGTAMAYTYTYDDDYANWPGHYIFAGDEYGTPIIQDIQGVTVVTNGNGYLQSVAIEMIGRRVEDALFINTDWGVGQDYESWDYYVTDTTLDNGDGSFYAVNSFDPLNDYIFASVGRVGHPVGIVSDKLSLETAMLDSIVWNITDEGGTGYMDDKGVLTYTFNDGIFIGSDREFVIGYTPYCANDVFLTPVPEPLTILLFGFGLLGLGLARRKS